MKNRGSTPILTNLVVVHPRNIHTKCEANMCSCLKEEVEKLKAQSPQPNGVGAVNKIHHRLLPFTTALHKLATAKATPYMLGHC